MPHRDIASMSPLWSLPPLRRGTFSTPYLGSVLPIIGRIICILPIMGSENLTHREAGRTGGSILCRVIPETCNTAVVMRLLFVLGWVRQDYRPGSDRSDGTCFSLKWGVKTQSVPPHLRKCSP